MEHDLDQLVEAISIAANPVASNPTQASLHNQALEFLQDVIKNAVTTWRAALSLFVEAGPDGGRKYSPDVRFFALRVLDEFLEQRCVVAPLLLWVGRAEACFVERSPWIATPFSYFDHLSSHTSKQNTSTVQLNPLPHVRLHTL